MLCNERLCPGTFIYICVKTEDENGKRRKKQEKYRVIKHYPHYLLVENAFGFKKGITNAELAQNGVGTQLMVGTP